MTAKQKLQDAIDIAKNAGEGMFGDKVINARAFAEYANPVAVRQLAECALLMFEALEYTQSNYAVIGVDSDGGPLRGVPDKFMMRNRCRDAIKAVNDKMSEG